MPAVAARLDHHRPTQFVQRLVALVMLDRPIDRLEQIVRLGQNLDRSVKLQRHVVRAFGLPIRRPCDNRHLISSHDKNSLKVPDFEIVADRGQKEREAEQRKDVK